MATDVVTSEPEKRTRRAPRRTRIARLLACGAIVYAALIATHRGEFWPLSTFPMFSRAGRPFERVVVRAVDDSNATSDAWLEADALPGAPLPLASIGVQANDLARLAGPLADDADAPAQREAIASLLAHSQGASYVVFVARGEIEGSGRVHHRYRAVATVPRGRGPGG